MDRDYIIISRFNEGHIGRRYADSNFVMVKDGKVSQSFKTMDGLTRSWQQGKIKWSDDGKQTEPETTELRGTELNAQSPQTLPASEATGDAEPSGTGSGGEGADSANTSGQELAEPAEEKTGTRKTTRRRSTRRTAKK